jgi:hypothetical protein
MAEASFTATIPTQEAAAEFVAKLNEVCDELQSRSPVPVDIINDYGKHCYWWPEYSHTIQIPRKD